MNPRNIPPEALDGGAPVQGNVGVEEEGPEKKPVVIWSDNIIRITDTKLELDPEDCLLKTFPGKFLIKHLNKIYNIAKKKSKSPCKYHRYTIVIRDVEVTSKQGNTMLMYDPTNKNTIYFITLSANTITIIGKGDNEASITFPPFEMERIEETYSEIKELLERSTIITFTPCRPRKEYDWGEYKELFTITPLGLYLLKITMMKEGVIEGVELKPAVICFDTCSEKALQLNNMKIEISFDLDDYTPKYFSVIAMNDEGEATEKIDLTVEKMALRRAIEELLLRKISDMLKESTSIAVMHPCPE